MSATKATTSDSSGLCPLAEGIKNDREEDSRSCPHDCHGSLTLTESDRVVCNSCRCTPDGVYLPLPEPEYYVTTHGRQYDPDGPGEITDPDSWDGKFPDGHDEYDGTTKPRLAGGYEEVYDHNEERRPHGVDDEYTWDLSSSNYETINTTHEWAKT